MKLREWFVLLAAVLVWALWSEYCYEKGAESAFQECSFDA